ncbi:MAG: nucleotidyltransferase family protein [Candidatus Zixiibacteriota bacterium]|nr:MAG: nucleotidyltransferase family protein [candidate division Zixibacteria bacterium]
MTITGVLLAAGSSSRMGSANKLLLKYRGHTMVEECLIQMQASNLDRIIVITGYEHDRVEEVLRAHMCNRTDITHNADHALGRAESIKRAVSSLTEDVDAALFMVSDKPEVASGLIDRAIERFRRDRPDMMYVETPAGRGHPVVFSRRLFPDLLRLQGDRVGDDLIAGFRGSKVVLKDERPQIDVDDEADYHTLLSRENSPHQDR